MNRFFGWILDGIRMIFEFILYIFRQIYRFSRYLSGRIFRGADAMVIGFFGFIFFLIFLLIIYWVMVAIFGNHSNKIQSETPKKEIITTIPTGTEWTETYHLKSVGESFKVTIPDNCDYSAYSSKMFYFQVGNQPKILVGGTSDAKISGERLGYFYISFYKDETTVTFRFKKK